MTEENSEPNFQTFVEISEFFRKSERAKLKLPNAFIKYIRQH